MNTALIVGSRGQDGRILSRSLLDQGYRVVGLHLDGVTVHVPEGGEPESTAGPTDITSEREYRALLERYEPGELYYLAAVHSSAEAGDDGSSAQAILDASLVGPIAMMEAALSATPDASVFVAGSSHVFARSAVSPQTESTRPSPSDVYGIAKLGAWRAAEMFREVRGLRASCGILYHHDSEFRQGGFLATRVVDVALKIAAGEVDTLELGDPEAVIDWGYAGDSVSAMQMMVRSASPSDYVIATGRGHTILDYLRAVSSVLGIDLESRVVVRPGLLRRRYGTDLIGDSGKIRTELGWVPEVTLDEIARRIVEARRGPGAE